ncbi:MAG: hypothetical protein QXK37_01715 [Candidatus Woesearchaeota archaeon]
MCAEYCSIYTHKYASNAEASRTLGRAVIVDGTGTIKSTNSVADAVRSEYYPIRLGNSLINVVNKNKSGAYITYLWVHQNEKTAIEAARIVHETKGGRLVVIEGQKPERLICFDNNGKSYRFDPNRIYTIEGIVGTLNNYCGNGYSKADAESTRLVNKLAEVVKSSLLPNSPVLAVHNNVDFRSKNGKDFSARSYLEDDEFIKQAKEVFINDSEPDDFFLVTHEQDFHYMRKKGYNTVLAREHINDGSMSYYCGKMNIRYVNCEAIFGRLKKQIKMIEDAVIMLSRNA